MHNLEWDRCCLCDLTGQASDKAKINSVSVTPDPPKIGQNINVDANVTFCKFKQSAQHNNHLTNHAITFLL